MSRDMNIAFVNEDIYPSSDDFCVKVDECLNAKDVKMFLLFHDIYYVSSFQS